MNRFSGKGLWRFLAVGFSCTGLVLLSVAFMRHGWGDLRLVQAAPLSGFSSLAPSEVSLSARFFYRPRTGYLLKPDALLSTSYADFSFHVVAVGTNLLLRPGPLPLAGLARPSLGVTPEEWYKLIRADSEEAQKRRKRDVEEAVQRRLRLEWEETDTELRIQGRQTIGFSFGKAFYLDGQGKNLNNPTSTATKSSPELDQNIDIHIAGRIGKKVTVNVDTSRQTLQRLQVDYDAKKEAAFVQRITAGNIPVSIAGSALASGSSGGGGESFGIKLDAKRAKVDLQFIASMARGIPAEVTYKGNKMLHEEMIPVRNYQALKHFILPAQYQPGTLKVYLDDRRGLVREIRIASSDCVELRQGPEWQETGDSVIEIRRSMTRDFNLYITYQPVAGDLTPLTNAGYNAVYTNIVSGQVYRYIPLLLANKESPYEFKGVYRLAQSGLVETENLESFQIRLLEATSLDEYVSARQFVRTSGGFIEDNSSWSDYSLDEPRGLIAFRSREPWRDASWEHLNQDPDKYIYTYTPLAESKKLSLYVKYKVATKGYQLHFDVIEGSEVVKVDGSIWTRGVDYRIDYFSGALEFLRLVNPESEVNIIYQYSPYGGFSQQFLVGMRADYKPWDWFSLSGLGVYNGRQRPVRIPTPSSAAEEKLVGSLGGRLSLSGEKITSLLTNAGVSLKKTVPLDFSLSGEVAGSLYNPNNFGLAMLDDFDGKNIRSVAIDDRRFLLYTPVDTEVSNEYPRSERGYLYFRDYFDYGLKRYVSFSNANKLDDPALDVRENIAYADKPGPYVVGEGHIDSMHFPSSVENVQKSLVFDYDFRYSGPGKGWASVIYSQIFSRSGADFTPYLEANLWVKLIPYDGSPTNQVALRLGLGEFSEDIDDDGSPLEEEETHLSEGFRFNDEEGRGNTWVGGSPYRTGKGDGVRQTEDLNGNRRLDRSRGRTNLFLPGGEYAIVSSGNAPETVQSKLKIRADSQWHLVRITINKDAMTPEQQRLWQRGIKHLVLILEQDKGTRGKLLIDTLNFVGPTYSDLRVNNFVNDTNVFRKLNLRFVNTLDKSGDDSYFEHSLRSFTQSDEFAKLYPGEKTFDYLHGRKTEMEWRQTLEEAMEMTYYDLGNHDFSREEKEQTNTMVLAGRFFPVSHDFRFYKMLKMWVKAWQVAGDEWFFIRFGSSAQDYYEYRVRASEMTKNPWYLLRVDMRSDAFASCTNRFYAGEESYRVQGLPNLRAVSYIAYGLYGENLPANNAGRLWFNDVYLDKVEYKGGYAYTYSASVAWRGHLAAGYGYSYSGKEYSGIGAAGSGQDVESRNLSLAWQSIPWLPVSGSWSRAKSESDREDVSLPYSMKGLSESEVYSLSGSLSMSAWDKIFKKYAENAPHLQGTYRFSVSSNLNFRNRAAEDYSVLNRASTESWNTSLSWKPPFMDKLKLKGVNTSFGYGYSRSDTRNWQYHGTNTSTNYVANPVSVSHSFQANLSLNWSYQGTNGPGYAKSRFAPIHRLLTRLSLGIGEWGIAPTFSYSTATSEQRLFAFQDGDGTLVAVTNDTTYYEPLTSSRSRSFATPVKMGRFFFLTPDLNYNVQYNESGFFRRPAASPVSNDMIRNPSFQFSMAEKLGEVSFKNFPIRSVSLNYARNFSLADAGVRDDRNQGLDYLGSALTGFGDVFAPVPFQFLPISIFRGMPAYFPNMDFISRWTNRKEVALSLSETIGMVVGLDILKTFKGSVSYSFGQTTTRSRGYNYTFSQTHSASYGSSINLMERLKGFLLWKQDPKAKFKKSSSLGYSVRYSFGRDYITSLMNHSLSPNLNFTYGWRPEQTLNLSSSYVYTLNNLFSPSNAFHEYVRMNIPSLYPTLNKDGATFHPRADGALTVSATYGFPSNLPETWTVPLIRKTIRLDTRINHSSTLSFANRIYYWGKDPSRSPDDLLAQVAYRHAIRYDVTANITGNIWLKFAYDLKGIKNDRNEVADREQVGSFETGIQLQIVF